MNSGVALKSRKKVLSAQNFFREPRLSPNPHPLHRQFRGGRGGRAPAQKHRHAARASQKHEHAQHDLRPYGEGGRDAERQPDGADRGKHFKDEFGQLKAAAHLKEGQQQYAQYREQNIRRGELRGVFYVFIVQPPFERLRRAFAADSGEQREHEYGDGVRLDAARRRTARPADEHQEDGQQDDCRARVGDGHGDDVEPGRARRHRREEGGEDALSPRQVVQRDEKEQEGHDDQHRACKQHDLRVQRVFAHMPFVAPYIVPDEESQPADKDEQGDDDADDRVRRIRRHRREVVPLRRHEVETRVAERGDGGEYRKPDPLAPAEVGHEAETEDERAEQFKEQRAEQNGARQL